MKGLRRTIRYYPRAGSPSGKRLRGADRCECNVRRDQPREKNNAQRFPSLVIIAFSAGSRSATVHERPAPKHVAMTWARRLKRVFGIEIEQCVRCGGRLEVIASIAEPALIERILAHRRERGEDRRAFYTP